MGRGRVPLEVLVDLKCESNEFDRLVPQTDAMFHYDKFNRCVCLIPLWKEERRTRHKWSYTVQTTFEIKL